MKREHVKRMLARLLALVFVSAVLSVWCDWPESVRAEPLQFETDWEYLCEAIEAHRNLFESGEFRAAGESVLLMPDGVEVHGPVNVFCAFDFPAGKLRFDRDEPADWVERASDGTLTTPRAGGQFIRNGGEIIALRRNDDSIYILPPHRADPGWTKALDFRGLGLLLEHDLLSGVPFTEVWDNYGKSKPYEVTRDSNNLWQVKWLIEEATNTRRTLWIDARKGFWPIRTVIQTGPTSRLHFSSELTIEEHSKLWVPKKYSWVGQTLKQDLVFDWENINEPVSAHLFTRQALNKLAVKNVIDKKLGAPVVLERIEKTIAGDSSMSIGRASFIVFNLAIVAILCVLVALKRKSFQRI